MNAFKKIKHFMLFSMVYSNSYNNTILVCRTYQNGKLRDEKCKIKIDNFLFFLNKYFGIDGKGRKEKCRKKKQEIVEKINVEFKNSEKENIERKKM
jgi:hypothetical protein